MTEEKIMDVAGQKMFKTFRDAYQQKNWTQRFLASLLDVSPQQFNRAIRGLDNGPTAKSIRAKARKILEIEED